MENNKKRNWIISIIIIAVVIMAAAGGCGKKIETLSENNDINSNAATEESNNIVYVEYSDGTTTVSATFYNDPTDFKNSTVTFEEPTIGKVTLPVAVSGSGARYANEDASIVFWEHQGEATITKDGKDVFVGKIVNTIEQ